MQNTYWQGKVVVICGASSGLGREFALQLAAQAVRQMVLVARSEGPLFALREHLMARFPALPVDCHLADVCELQQLTAVADRLKDYLPSVDLLVQAVGQSDRGTVLELEWSHMQGLLAANLRSSLNAIQSFAPIMTAPGGHVVLIGSLASKFAPRFLGGYSIAKHALAGLAQQARLELAEKGIAVTLACPGPITRSDAGYRYAAVAASGHLPAAAQQPGGGARIRGLDPALLARDILYSAARGRAEIIRPRKARLLLLLSSIAPGLADRLLRKNTT